MKVIFKIIIPFYILTSGVTSAQDTSIVKFFPLNIGNVWIYSGSAQTPWCIRSFDQRLHIDTSLIFNGKTYFRLNYTFRYTGGSGSCDYFYISAGYYRIDSISGNLYRYSTNSGCTLTPNDVLIDSLRSRINDTTKLCAQQYQKKILSDTNSNSIFGITKASKSFTGGDFFEYSFIGRYTKDFGITEYHSYGMFAQSHSTLKGCIINGTLYGDTNYYYVGIQPLLNEIPNAFNLSQNYPNPFNPATQIKFDISKLAFTQLTVYDAAGKEIDKLVSEELKPGTYSVSWDAASYTSGVYFYKIQTGVYTETRKMVLLK